MTTTTYTDSGSAETEPIRPTSPGLERAVRNLEVIGVAPEKIERMRHLLGDCIHPCACGSTYHKVDHLKPFFDSVHDALEVLLDFADLRYSGPLSQGHNGSEAVFEDFIREAWLAEGNPEEWIGRPSLTSRPTLKNLLRSRSAGEVQSADIIPGFLRRGERLMVTGFEGNGKTFLRDQWAVMYAAGVHPLTLEPIEGGNVVIFDLEGTAEQRIERLERLIASAEIFGNVDIETVLERIEIRSTFPFHWSDELERRWLREIGPSQPDLIVIGPIYRLPSIDDISIEEEAKKLIRRIDGLVDWGRRPAVIMEHHSPHGDSRFRPRRPYGHSSLLRWPEFGIHLDASGSFTRWRGDRREVNWPARFERGDQWPWMPIVNDDATPAVTTGPVPVDLASSIVEFLEGRPGDEFTTTDLPTQMRAASISCRTEKVSKVAASLAESGRITVRNGPRGSRLYSANLEIDGI